MTSKIFSFQQFKVVIGQPYKVENRLAVSPVQARRVNVAMHKAVFVHVSDSARQLSEDEEQALR